MAGFRDGARNFRVRPLADLQPHRPICAEVVGRANAQTDPDELFRRIVYIAPPPIGLGEAA